ncbi:hypothetical protein RhiirA4_490241, partial [Rhizophagus irregularis]
EIIEKFVKERGFNPKRVTPSISTGLSQEIERISQPEEEISFYDEVARQLNEKGIMIEHTELIRIIQILKFSVKQVLKVGFIEEYLKIASERDDEIEAKLKIWLEENWKESDNEEEYDEYEEEMNEYREIQETSESEDDNYLEEIENNPELEEFDEDQFENIIKTPPFPLSSSSESEELENIKPKNKGKEKDKTPIEIPIPIPINPIPNNPIMGATNDEVKQAIQQAFQTMFGHNIGANLDQLPANNIAQLFTNTNAAIGNLQDPVNRAAKIRDLPVYYGGEQDPHEWIRDFEKVWLANGYVEGANQANKVNKAAACMLGEAAD